MTLPSRGALPALRPSRLDHLAVLLSPIRYSWAGVRFADAMGGHPTACVTAWFALALRRCGAH